jgi:anthranilate synthase component 1
MSRKRAAPLLSPPIALSTDLLALHRAHPSRYPYLLESVARGTRQARYDILFAFPQATLEAGAGAGAGCFLERFDDWWRDERVQEAADTPPLPFHGGWFLYLGYELAAEVEPTLALPLAGDAFPRAFATRIPAALVRDHERSEIRLVAEAGHEKLIERMAADLEEAAAAEPVAEGGGSVLAAPLREEDPGRYLDGVRRVLDYVRAGDVYQVNLSRQWSGELLPGIANATLYERLRRRNPGPFAGLCVHGEAAILCSSPERLVEVRGRRIRTRPIAGTRPRGGSAPGDKALALELLANDKERAEHLMLVDLERNDLGRVCVPGTIEVDEFMTLESYAHVHHIVSNVSGRLREQVSPAQAIGAVFPGGTITGCPKLRCMEIVAEIEQTGRGPYTGSLGYVNRDGSLDLNILIRTMLRAGRRVAFRAGAGIVADSDPLRELEETRDKARGLILSLEGKR